MFLRSKFLSFTHRQEMFSVVMIGGWIFENSKSSWYCYITSRFAEDCQYNHDNSYWVNSCNNLLTSSVRLSTHLTIDYVRQLNEMNIWRGWQSTEINKWLWLKLTINLDTLVLDFSLISSQLISLFCLLHFGNY